MMPPAPPRPPPVHRARRSRGAVPLALALLAAATGAYTAGGCSTEESVLFDPSCPAGRCNNTPSGGPGPTGGASGCPEFGDPSCPIKFGEQIFKPLLDKDGSAKCADALCHGDPANVNGDLLLVPGNAAASRNALLEYQFDKPPGPYISCTTPADSKFLCNMSLADGAMNKYGKCLTTMPLVDDVGAKRLTETELELIAGWIACGAPNN